MEVPVERTGSEEQVTTEESEFFAEIIRRKEGVSATLYHRSGDESVVIDEAWWEWSDFLNFDGDPPSHTNGELRTVLSQSPSGDGVPDIRSVEPVYPDEDAGTSRWVSCVLEWDSERAVFVNREADDSWIIDDNAYPDSNYHVNGETFYSLPDAMARALSGSEWDEDDATVVIEPEQGHEPNWGPSCN